MKKITSLSLIIYKTAISQTLKLLFGGGCRFSPPCSDYMKEAIEKHGAGKGTALGIKRLSRCHPFGGAGFDPVPQK